MTTLNLSRRIGQRVGMNLSDDPDDVLIVTVTDIHNGNVRLAFDAPEDIEIWREEIALKNGEAWAKALARDGNE